MDSVQLVRDVITALEAGDMAKAATYLTDDFTFSGPVPQPIAKAAFIGLQGALVQAIPDWKFNIKDLTAKGDKVTGTVQITGTHTATLGSIMGMPPVPATGKKIALPLEHLTMTVRGDKVSNLEADQVPGGGVPGVLSQIGVQMPH